MFKSVKEIKLLYRIFYGHSENGIHFMASQLREHYLVKC